MQPLLRAFLPKFVYTLCVFFSEAESGSGRAVGKHAALVLHSKEH